MLRKEGKQRLIPSSNKQNTKGAKNKIMNGKKKNRKFARAIAIILCVASLVSLVGCGMEPVVPTQPTEIIEPSFPDETTRPTEVTTEPTVSTEPSETTSPTEPVTTPSEPAEMPTGPQNPTEQAPPSTPSEPTETIPAPTEPSETIPPETKPTEEVNPTEPDVEAGMTFKEANETVYANTSVNVRKGPSTDYEKIGSLKWGESITRIGIGDSGWDKVLYNEEPAYMFAEYIQTDKPIAASELSYPLTYSDESCSITIYKEWYKNAYVYAAHITFSDYTRFGTSCANGKYNNGYETTSHAANRLNAIFAVNGCYSAPYLDYTVIRSGVLCNGGDRNLWLPAIYSSNNGLFLSAWESGGTQGIAGKNVTELHAAGLVTDTFCFGPPSLVNGEVLGKNEGARAQRTFVGTNGNAGDLWVCVSDGRYNDGKSAGLTFYEAAEYLKTKGCTFGIHLDGGGSSTMYFNGKVLNAAAGNQRAVVDFVYFK